MQNYLKDRELRIVIKEATSSWRKVPSGVLQGSVLAPIMFQIYVNDMGCGVTSYMNLLADDAKLMRVVKNNDDCRELQGDNIDKIDEWSKRWKLDLNAKKCHVMELGKCKRRQKWKYKMGQEEIL